MGAAEGESGFPGTLTRTLRQKDWHTLRERKREGAFLTGERLVTRKPGEPAHRRGKRQVSA